MSNANDGIRKAAKEDAVQINKLAQELHEAAVAKGFWDVEDAEGKHLAKMVSELGEIVQADRVGIMYEVERDGAKPEGVMAEMADFVMMALDYAAYKNAIMPFVSGWEKLEDHIKFELENNEGLETRVDVIRSWSSAPAYRFVVCAASDFSNIAGPVRTAIGVHEDQGYTAHCMALWCEGRGYDLFEIIRLKMEYNRNRPKLHGRLY